MVAIPQHEVLVERILTVYDRSTSDQRVAGARWYPMAGRIVEAIATEAEAKPRTVAMVLAALSPRNPWAWNVQDAFAFCLAARHGVPRPSATTFERNRQTAWSILTEGEQAAWVGAAPKVKAFVAAILGDREAVVVDVWAFRVALGEAPPRRASFDGRLFEAIAAAYRDAAKQRGLDPRDIQATTWLVAQTEGLASNRRGRHDLALKAGTALFVRTLLTA